MLDATLLSSTGDRSVQRPTGQGDSPVLSRAIVAAHSSVRRIPENSNITMAAVLSLRREIANRANAPHDAIAPASHSSVA